MRANSPKRHLKILAQMTPLLCLLLGVMLWGCAGATAQQSAETPTPQGGSQAPAVTGGGQPDAGPTVPPPKGGDQPVSPADPVSPKPNDNASKITGHVTDRAGKPIAKAVVMIVKGTAPYPERTYLTNDAGEYSIGVAPGDYTVSVNAGGFKSMQQNVSVTKEQASTLDFQLEAE